MCGVVCGFLREEGSTISSFSYIIMPAAANPGACFPSQLSDGQASDSGSNRTEQSPMLHSDS